MIDIYDRTMVGRYQRRYYEDSGFFNFGYWDGQAMSQREASAALVDRLIARIPRRAGRILDVACGLGASSERVMRSYAPDMITGGWGRPPRRPHASRRIAALWCLRRVLPCERCDAPQHEAERRPQPNAIPLSRA
jgi:hypothetical protein